MNVLEQTDSKECVCCTVHEPKNRDTVTAFYTQVGDTFWCFIEGEKVVSQMDRNPF